jgi:hypothetical protein
MFRIVKSRAKADLELHVSLAGLNAWQIAYHGLVRGTPYYHTKEVGAAYSSLIIIMINGT